MTRGNQRDLAREKAKKKAEKAGKGKKKDDTGLSLTQRRERDAEIMREKQKKAEGEKLNKEQSK